jgi:hypothetical protein
MVPFSLPPFLGTTKFHPVRPRARHSLFRSFRSSLALHPSYPAHYRQLQIPQIAVNLSPRLLDRHNPTSNLLEPVYLVENLQRPFSGQPIQRPDNKNLKPASTSMFACLSPL